MVHNTALYDVPVVLRASVLHISGGRYRQVKREANGTWVYRFEGRASVTTTDAHISDLRNDQDPEWDGPVRVQPPATFAEVLAHFQRYKHDGRDADAELAKLYDHFVCAMQQRPFRDE